MTPTKEFGGLRWRIGLIGAAITLAVEDVCYRRIEMPVLQLKDRFVRASLVTLAGEGHPASTAPRSTDGGAAGGGQSRERWIAGGR